MTPEQTPMFSELPQDAPEKPKKHSPNILMQILKEVMSERGITQADIVKATGISSSTLGDWVSGKAGTQKADVNLMKLAGYLNLSLGYLLFGLGSDDPAYLDFESKEVKND